jgi:hypothetical protein
LAWCQELEGAPDRANFHDLRIGRALATLRTRGVADARARGDKHDPRAPAQRLVHALLDLRNGAEFSGEPHFTDRDRALWQRAMQERP